MNGKERVNAIFDLDVRLHEELGSDLFWACTELDTDVYQHPGRKSMFDIFGENFIVSPSHEALLANVSIENVLAMRNAAIKK